VRSSAEPRFPPAEELKPAAGIENESATGDPAA